MSNDLKLCPFCGGVPELCDGDIRLVDAEYINMKALLKASTDAVAIYTTLAQKRGFAKSS